MRAPLRRALSAGPAAAATKRQRAARSSGAAGSIWGLESDPAHVAPFGGILTANHWAKEFAYDSLVEWDRNLNVRPALAEKFEIINKTQIRWTLKRGVRFHNGKEVTAADVKYSVERMLNPPLPGSISTVAQVPAIDRVQVVSKYVFILHLKQPDARVIGFFAWQRYAPIVPEGLYDQINVSRNAIGTGPYRMLGYEPNDRIEYVRFANHWKKGFPYMNSMQLKILGDEQARVAALRAGAIDGATLSVEVARSLANNSHLTVLKGPNAAFRELQMTIKRGEDKPWHKKGVRLAVNHAINRADIIRRVYSGEAEYSGHVPPGYGPWPLTDSELKTKYEKFDLPMAKKLMADAGESRGFKVTMTTFALQDYPLVAAVVQSQLRAINIDVEIVAQEAGTFAANNGRGTLRLGSHRPRHARRRRRLRGRVPPGRARLQHLVPGVPEPQGVAGDRQRPDPARPRQAGADLQGGAAGAHARPGADPARGDQEVPGRPQAREEHVRRVQRLQHGAPQRVAGRVTDSIPVDLEGRRFGGVPPTFRGR